MNGASFGVRRGGTGIDDVRLPTWISISSPPASHRSPIRSAQPPVVTPDRRKEDRRATSPAKPTKRTQSTFLTGSPSTYQRRNILVWLCQKQVWNDVCIRCQTHPNEAVPMPLGPVFTNAENHNKSSSFPPIKRERKNSDIPFMPPTSCLQSVHCITPLGIACQAEFETSDKMLGVVEKLLAACPDQVQSNDGVAGHTPLRDAIRNNCSSPEVIRLLIHADQCLPGKDNAVFRRDRDGLSPIDHLIMGVHAGTPAHSLESLQLLVQKCPKVVQSNHDSQQYMPVSPLIRLLSMGTSFGLHMRANHSNNSAPPSHENMTATPNESNRMARILECAKCLISPEMSCVKTKSTKCTPLHVAIRNYGNVLPLIQLLLESDSQCKMVQERNLYGDLPLHVACSVGVPVEVLQLVLQHTVAASSASRDVHPLVWSVNKSGYTPVDLEWMRHIEGGRGFYEVRSFYPLEASGIRNQGTQQDKFYKALLQEAVDQVMASNEFSEKSREVHAKRVVGALLDRIVLIVQVAHGCGRLSQSTRQTDFLLHAASALSRVPGPTLPSPLLRLFSWMYPNQIGQRDATGKLPIHHSVMSPPDGQEPNDFSPSCSNMHEGAVDRTSWIKLLLDRAPRSAKLADDDMRLPLHYALDSRNHQDMGGFKTEWNGIIQQLVGAYPDSVDRRDPESLLFPFMQAAQDPHSTMETVFYLLRRNPTLVQGGT